MDRFRIPRRNGIGEEIIDLRPIYIGLENLKSEVDELKTAGLGGDSNAKPGEPIDVELTDSSFIYYNPQFPGSVPRTVMDRLRDVVSIKDYGAVGDGLEDDTAALHAAAISGRVIYFPPGNYRATSVVPMESSTTFIGDGDSCILTLDYVGTSQNFLTATGKSNITIRGLKINGGRDGTHTAGWPVVFTACTGCVVESCYFVNSPSESVLIRNGSTRCKVMRCRFAVQGQGTAHIYFLNAVTDCEASFNYFEDSVGGCIWASGGALDTTIIGNECATSDFELIGIRYDCVGGIIANNIATQTGDNGISVTGVGFTVIGNKCWENGHNGIGVYGESNTVTGNQCFDNGKSAANTYAGILMSANFGGLCKNNVVSSNAVYRRNGATNEQYYGVNIEGTAYTLWAAGQVVNAQTFRYYQSRLYISATSGTTGATPLTHTTGTVSDGAVSWTYVGQFDNVAAVPAGNRVFGNEIQPHTGGDVRLVTNRPNGYNEESRQTDTFRVSTPWANGQAKVIGDYVTHTHSDGAPRVYRAVTNGTTGATPPTHSSGSASDGGVTWQFVEVGSLINMVSSGLSGQTFSGPILIRSIDSPTNPVGLYAASTNPEGNVIARNGSLYLRDNALTGIEGYLKTGTTGTNLGWLPFQLRRSGTTANRPAGVTQVGIEYFDTTLGKPVWSNGVANQWVDATGTVV